MPIISLKSGPVSIPSKHWNQIGKSAHVPFHFFPLILKFGDGVYSANTFLTLQKVFPNTATVRNKPLA